MTAKRDKDYTKNKATAGKKKTKKNIHNINLRNPKSSARTVLDNKMSKQKFLLNYEINF